MKSHLKITNPERIGCILVRICDSKLRVLLRSSATSTVAIKGVAINAYLNSSPSQILISQISLKGMDLIKNLDEIYVEFIMMSTKIFFTCRKLTVSKNSIYLSIPNQLTSVERRQNARFNTTPDYSAYVEMSSLAAAKSDYTAPHVLPHFDFLRSRLLLSDISIGGACAVTDFPYAKDVLTPSIIDNDTKLILPLKTPIALPMEVRWFKKIKEHIEPISGRDKALVSYKVGLQFIEAGMSDETKIKINQFINILNQSQAI